VRLAFETPTACRDYAQFAEAYVAEAFSTLVVQRLPLRSRTLLETSLLADGRARTRVRVVPELHLPGAMARLIGDRAVYFDEVAVYDPATHSAAISIETPAGERVHAGGVARLCARGGELHLCFDGEVRVRVPGLGALIERRVVAEVERSCRDVFGVLIEYLQSREPGRVRG
jgi:hypothetical protein